MIWHAAIEDCMRVSMELDCYPISWGEAKHTYKLEHGPLDIDITPEIVLRPHEADLGLNFYPTNKFDRSWQSSGVLQLREASSGINIEVENNLVSNYPFRFGCPEVLMRYLNTASARQLNGLRSIIVELSRYCEPCCDRDVPWRSWFKSCGQGWIAAIERLPAAIKLIKFELSWKCEYMGNQSVFANEMLAQLEIVTKNSQRVAPNAKIKVSDLHGLGSKDRDILQDIRDEIEDHSEHYKKWWKESREKTNSQREEA